MSVHLLRRLLVASLWIFWGGIALAQQCPPGQIAYGSGPGLNTCGPDNRQQQAPQRPTEQWERRWGAIATGGALGVATDKLSKQEASQTAMSDCAAKGGTNCKIEITYYNQCAVVVAAEDGSYNTPSNATLDGAIATGIKTCRDAGHSNCHVYYSACSLPVRIR
ncbi:DUF4189 domain-containing protein [Variovorax fucosicus]|uniref:DUF4189 domain-containing protein n=1 Tax=Variovorax fucosicus TaxID=3053517 RepID=UPI0033655A8A